MRSCLKLPRRISPAASIDKSGVCGGISQKVRRNELSKALAHQLDHIGRLATGLRGAITITNRLSR